MFSENQKISNRQLQALLLLEFLGTPLLFMPSKLAEIAGKECWQIMLLGGLLAAFFAPLMMQLGKMEPGWTAVEWFRSVFGYGFGAVLSLGLGVKLLLDGALELRIFAEILRRTMLPYTPLPFLLGGLFLLCFFTARRGVEGRARAAEILLFLVWIPFLVLLAAAAFSVGQANFLPLGFPTGRQIWQGIAVTQPLFQSMAFLLLVPPFLAKPQRAPKSAFFATLAAGLIFTAMTLLALAVYGADSLVHKVFPSLQVMERVSLSGIFLTRQDLFLLWFWMSAVFIFVSGSLFFGSVFLQRLFGQGEQKRKSFLWVFALLLLGLSLLPESMESAYDFRNKIQPVFSGIYLALFPLIFFVKHFITERRKKRA